LNESVDMKKSIILLLIVLTLCLSACSTTSGVIQISATNLKEGTWEGSGDGRTLRLRFVANSSKIAFNTVSIANAQKK
jgi:predicted small secreted protein